MNRISIDQPTPKEPGTYLWMPELTGDPQVIHVDRIPERDEYGCRWPSYLAVRESRGRSVEMLRGKFSKQLFVGTDHIKEIA